MSNQLHVVVGMGLTGFSCASYLYKRGTAIAIVDSRPKPPQLANFQQAFPDVSMHVGSLDCSLFDQAACIVMSPGMSVKDPVIAKHAQRGIPVIGDIELFAQAVTAPVIAITGTNAKSTVTTLVGLMMQAAGFRAAVGGNLGVPVLDLLSESAEAYVLELSSFQLETTYSLKPRVATVLNVTPDHMDRYATVTEYQQAKLRVYHDCQTAVCNRDDRLTEYANAPSSFHFTLQTPGEREFGLRESYLAFGDELLLAVRELPVVGRHYQANALAALALGFAFGLPFAPMLDVLREFKGLPHRCQFIRERQGVKWYNDSKGTNVGATQAAIEGLGREINGKLILIAGGVGKNADFHSLLPAIKQYSRHVVLIGEAATELAAVLDHQVPVSFANTLSEAIEQAAQTAQADDSVLLSPACASFDMFKNYEHRGEVFTELVEQL